MARSIFSADADSPAADPASERVATGAPDDPGTPAAFGSAERELVDRVLARLVQTTGIDFRGYRRSTIERRIRNRMISVDERCLDGYYRRLCAEPDEAAALLQRISIKVSRFFRNRETFEALGDDVLPRLAERAVGRGLRIWSAGCSFGEEAYSLAMLLEERGIDGDVLATDIDAAALDRAAQGVFAAESREAVGEARWARFFEPLPGGSRVVAPLRRRVRFMSHNLLAATLPVDQPFDLICCRNVLIYVERQVQAASLQRLLGGLRSGGFLCLGEAEWPPVEVLDQLQPWPRRTRLFKKVSGGVECADSI